VKGFLIGAPLVTAASGAFMFLRAASDSGVQKPRDFCTPSFSRLRQFWPQKVGDRGKNGAALMDQAEVFFLISCW